LGLVSNSALAAGEWEPPEKQNWHCCDTAMAVKKHQMTAEKLLLEDWTTRDSREVPA
jgi:hypothetical protein